jgi:hypothetical protein
VNIQASRDVVIQFRGGLLDQPFLTLIERASGAGKAGAPGRDTGE